MTLRFGSVCSGIEAASVAWHPLGWRAAWLSEIEPFPAAVLAHHYPEVPNLGDMTTLPARIRAAEVEAPDILAGGTPCQAFSLAGNRRSLSDERGNLSLVFCELADAIDDVRRARGKPPAAIFWENVPGVFSTHDNAFGCFLAALAGEDEAIGVAAWPGAGVVDGRRRRVAWATLDAQFFGLAQRRRRVFVLAVDGELVRRAGDRADPAEILALGACLRRDTPTRPAARQAAARGAARGAAFGGNRTSGPIDVTPALLSQPGSGYKMDFESETLITGPLTSSEGPRAHGFGDFLSNQSVDANHLVPVALTGDGLVADPVSANEGRTYTHEGKTFRMHNCVQPSPAAVRRLTVTECERLQGFPDNYTAIPWRGQTAGDGPRYKALGNSWAVPVVRWIGSQIDSALRTHLLARKYPSSDILTTTGE